MLESPLILAFPLLMAFAAVMDVFTMTIPNRVSLILIGTFVCVAVLTGMSAETILTHVATAFAVLVVVIAMFARGWIGGGDAKLLAASSLWIGSAQLPDYMFAVVLVGGVLAIGLLAFRRFWPLGSMPLPAWAERLHDKATGIPYGVAIGGGALAVYPATPAFLALAV